MKRKCCFCGKEQNGGSGHIYTCKRKPENLQDKKEIKFLYLKYNFPDICNYENIFDDYITQNKSLPELKEKYDIDFKSIGFILDYFNITKRSMSESAKSITVPKVRQFYKENTDYEWNSQCPKVKKKKEQTCLERYGVDNIRKSEWFQKHMIKHYQNKYGMTCSEFMKFRWENYSDEEKIMIMDNFRAGIRSQSKLEKRIKNILDENMIEYTSQKFFRMGKKRIYTDICVNEIIIEVFGDFWHANPMFYKDTDVLNFPGGNKQKAKDIRKKDKKRLDFLRSKGYKVYVLWEHDIRKMNDDELIENIETILNS